MRRMVAAVAMMCSAFFAGAQSPVSGSVRDAATSEPVRGAVVVVLGANRELLVRTVTSPSGTFRVVQDGAAIVRVMRIGYSPQERRLDGAASPLVIELTPLGRQLRPISVNSNPVCPARADQAEALALWSSATDAFASMVVASAEAVQASEVLQMLYDKVVVNNGSRVLRQSTKRVLTDNIIPIRAARTPGELAKDGYVVHGAEASTYYAPDPQVLLDSSFAETHCLSIRRDAREHPEETGVAFIPTSDRNSIPDIAGVLWITRSPMALKSLDFAYSGVDQPLVRIGAGGRLDFETLSNGVPIIRQWQVRSPKLRYVVSGRGTMRESVGGRQVQVMEIHESGGLIVEGELEGTRVTAALATLGGHVRSSRTVEPVVGATVSLDSTDHSVVTGADGRFTLDRVLPGPYTLRAVDSVVIPSIRVDSAGRVSTDSSRQQLVTRVATKDIEVLVDRPNSTDLTFPYRARVPSCQYDGEIERRFTVLGTVEGPGRARIANARVELTWADTSKRWRSDEPTFRVRTLPDLSTISTSVEAVADSAGGFIVCGIPGGRLIGARVLASEGNELVGSTRVSPDADDVSRRLRNRDVRGLRLVVRQPE